MASLALRHCSPLKKGTNPVRDSLAHSLLAQIDSSWQIERDRNAITRQFTFADFHETIGFVNAVAWMAHQQNHHPDMEISYAQCTLRYTSHAADGLTVNDFICAAKCDAIYAGNPAAEQSTGKTRARSDTGEHAKAPAQQPAKPEPSAATPALNLTEASELLDKTVERSEEAKRASQDEEDEFELIDPAEQLKKQHERATEQTRRAESTQTDPSPAAKPQAASKPESKNESKEKKDDKPAAQTPEDIDLMATVILPPGMESVEQSKDDDDEEATVILPVEESDASQPPAQNKSTGSDSARQAKENAPPTPEGEESDMEKTMVIRPPAFETADTPQDRPDQSAGDTPRQPTAAGTSTSQPQQPPTASEETSEEEAPEKTMALHTNPLRGSGATHTTRVRSPDDNNKTDAQRKPEQPTGKGKPDPEIEDDETLVMHSNTYRPVKKPKDGGG